MFEKHSSGMSPGGLNGGELTGIDQTRLDVHKWIAAPDPYSNHVANRKKRQPQTGTWLLRSKQYEHWLTSSKSFLWLYGIRMLALKHCKIH